MIREPKWKSLVVTTINPLFTPQQCQDIIRMGHEQKVEDARVGHKDPKEGVAGKYDIKKRITTISWIPFKAMPEMYRMIEQAVLQTNGNHFGFEGIQLSEYAQFTEYPKGGFYDWHMDCEVLGTNEPPVRKISMTILLSPQSEFEGGEIEFMAEGKKPPSLFQGQAIFFASFLRHRIAKIKKGMRRSLVMWFGGPPFK